LSHGELGINVDTGKLFYGTSGSSNAVSSSFTFSEITASGNISASGNIYMKQTTGTDNSVVILNSSNQLVTDEIDGSVWGADGVLLTENSETTAGALTVMAAQTANTTRTADNADFFPVFVDSNNSSATAENLWTSTNYLSYNPSNGILKTGKLVSEASISASTSINGNQISGSQISSSGNITAKGDISASGNVWSDNQYTWEVTARADTDNDDNWQGPNTKGIYTMEDWTQDHGTDYDDITSTNALARTHMNTGWRIPNQANYSCSIKSMDIYIQPNSNITHATNDHFSCSLWYSHNSDLVGETNVPDASSLTFVQRHAASVNSSQCKAADEKFFKYNNYHVSQSVNLDLAPGSIIYPRIKTVGTNDFIMNIHWIVNYTKISL
jgi:hypothetical protein